MKNIWPLFSKPPFPHSNSSSAIATAISWPTIDPMGINQVESTASKFAAFSPKWPAPAEFISGSKLRLPRRDPGLDAA